MRRHHVLPTGPLTAIYMLVFSNVGAFVVLVRSHRYVLLPFQLTFVLLGRIEYSPSSLGYYPSMHSLRLSCLESKEVLEELVRSRRFSHPCTRLSGHSLKQTALALFMVCSQRPLFSHLYHTQILAPHRALSHPLKIWDRHYFQRRQLPTGWMRRIR